MLPFIGNAHASSSRLVTALAVAASFGRGPGTNYICPYRLRLLRSSSTDAPNWCFSREGLCDASLHRQAYNVSGRLLPVHTVGTSLRRSPCDASLHRKCPRSLRPYPTGKSSLESLFKETLSHPLTSATPTTFLAVSYRRFPMVHIPGGTLTRFLTSETPPPSPVVYK